MRESRKYCPMGCAAVNPQAWGGDYPKVTIKAEVETVDTVAGKMALVCIDGPLTHKPAEWFDCYVGIAARLECALIQPDTVGVILKIDSPGGDVAGCFELAKCIREKAAIKPIHAYIDGVGASAAYALACACTSITAPPSALIGSIGIIEAIVSQVAADAAQGLQFLFVTSGDRKGDGNPHIPITEGANAALQSHVDGLAELFFGLVADMRQISSDKVQALQAGIFLAAEAADKGLIDTVATFDELTAQIGVSDMTFPKAKAEAAPPAEESGKAKLRKMIAAEMAEASEEDRKLYSKMLAGLDEKPAEASDADGDDDGDKKAKAESEKKDAEAKAEFEKKEADAKAQAAAALAKGQFDLAAAHFALKAEIQAERDAVTREKLFASRPDFDANTRAMMSAWPVEQVEAAVKTFPRVIVPAAAASAVGSVGVTQGKPTPPADADAEFIDRKMTGRLPPGAVTNHGAHLTLGYMTQAQAQAHLAKLTATAAEGSK